MTKITLKLPAGVQVPDGMKEGDTFQAMTTYKLGANGEAQLCEVDGDPIEGYSEDDAQAEPNNSQDDATEPMTQSLQERMMASAPPDAQ